MPVARKAAQPAHLTGCRAAYETIANTAPAISIASPTRSTIAAVRNSSAVDALKLERKAPLLTRRPTIQAAHQNPTSAGTGRLQGSRCTGSAGSLPRQMSLAIG